MTTHAPSLIQQLHAIAEVIPKLPRHEIADQHDYPNKLQQEALLRRAAEAVIHAKWALEEYHAGVMRTYDISNIKVTS